MPLVVVSTTLSLDGFMAGPNHEMDWIFDNDFLPDDPIPAIDDLIATSGAILSGRGSYDVGRRSQRTETSSAFGGAWSGVELVLTHHPPDDDVSPDRRFISGSIRDAVAAARDAANGKNVLIFGANTAQQCLAEGLVDELFLIVLPIVLGDGISLFGTGGGAHLFETIAVEHIGQAVFLRLRASG